MSLKRMLFSFGSPERPVKSFCFNDANGIPLLEASRTPIGLAWAYQDVLKGRNRLGQLSCVGEPIGNRVGVDNLAISLGDPWSAQCAKAQGDCFVYLSFYSPFATVTCLGVVPLNLKGMNSPFATTARLRIFSRASLLL
ncbi:hypothetical protein CRG98_018027 [Punica granatum]|uniref:Uncharacterized protein n=1 Tax=Punica granatum TaxID=22663 RepID=A0A2I0JZ35_PUNGR|nr:hypothetical protein CRG98_018027 [Punica granatum]